MVSSEELLKRTSRTFALAIPLMPEPARTEITLAYLLFRIADTLEDAENWDRDARLGALAEWADLLQAPQSTRAEQLSRTWLAVPPSDHPGYQLLLESAGDVIARVRELPLQTRCEILNRARHSTLGMRRFLGRADDRGRLRLETVDQLRDYCYVVAGIVGEMITAVILSHMDDASLPEEVWCAARAFGEGLQLVNILKDSSSDLHEGRAYLPVGTPRQAIFELARIDLREAARYIAALRNAGAEAGFLAFAKLPLRLAHGTLDRVELQGPGAKLSRAEVVQILEQVIDESQEPARAPALPQR